MRITTVALALAISVPAVTAQDFIHYKFDSSCTTEVINYATGPQALASNGTLQSTIAGSPWVAGKFGGGLSGGGAGLYNRVISGWNPGTQPVVGSLTMAWFMKERTPPGTALSYMMGAPSGGFRLFTNGVANRGLYQREILPSNGNPTRDFVLPQTTFDVQTAAATGWLHVAMVMDSVAQTADWYINGVSVLQLTGVPGASITLAGPFQVGYYSSASPYDIDEFLMSFRAYTAAEVLALSQSPRAGDGPFTSGVASQCGTLGLGTTGGSPSLGNALYGLTVAPASMVFHDVLIGFNRCTYAGSFPLPLAGSTLTPLAAGCSLLTDIAVSIGGVGSTVATVPLPIPSSTTYLGMNLYAQAVAIDLASMAISASTGRAVSVGW